jgi:hypothetical protein
MQATPDHPDNFKPVAVFQARFIPACSRDDFQIALDCNTVGREFEPFNQTFQAQAIGNFTLLTVQLQGHNSPRGSEPGATTEVCLISPART